MKKYLITLLIIPTLIFADAVIFSGSDVKTLKPNIDLFGVAKILTTSTIPTAGLVAPKGSIAMYTTTGDLYLKTGALNTDWTKNQTGPVNLATDVTGILPIANGGTGSATQNFVDLTTAQNIAGLKNFTDALTITSNSANSLAVGPNGTTNSVLQIDSSTASSATGVKVTGAAAGGGVSIAAISSGSNENLTLGSKGTGTTSIQVNGVSKYTASQQQNVFTTSASSTAANTKFLVTGTADSALTASTEALGVHFDLAQARQHATGTLAAQRDVRISPSTHSFVGASALTLAAALSIDGPPLGGTNATIASTTALRVTGGTTTGATNAYGVMIAAPNGATNNYAGIFTGGNVGVGTASPASLLHSLESNSASGNSNGLTIEQSGTGDALAHFILSGVQRYTMGIDNSDSDKFKIGTNADLGTSNLFTMTNAGMIGIGTAAPGTPIHVAATNATVYTPTSAALAIPANILTTIENLDTTDSTASLLGFVTRSGGAVNRSFIGNVSNSAGGSIVFGHRTGTTSYAERMRIDYLGNLGIGTSSPNANAILDVVSTTKAFMPPRMTTAQKNAVASPTAGMVVYDTDMKGISFYNGTAWTTTNNKNVATKTANYTALQSDDVLLGDATSGAITITLPTAVGNTGEVFHIKKIDSSVNAVTIATTSSQTIDGALTQPILFQYQTITIVSNGVGWSVL